MAIESHRFYSENLGFQIPTIYQDWSSFHPFSPVDNLNNLSAVVVDPQQTQTTTHFHFHQSSFPNRRASSSSSSSSVTFSPMAALNSELELQKQEIDFLLHLQKEKLRIALQEQRKQEVMGVLSNLEREAWKLMRQKEAELAQATRTGRELEERLKKAEIEKEAWKRMASAKEAMVMGLHSKLEEARERQFLVSNGAEDAESHNPSEEEEEGRSSRKVMGMGMGMACKSCRNRTRSVLFLPCRHLCSCKNCEAFLGSCPVCDTVKEASLEVLLL